MSLKCCVKVSFIQLDEMMKPVLLPCYPAQPTEKTEAMLLYEVNLDDFEEQLVEDCS